MPIRKVPGTDVEYYLISFDENGKERWEADGTLLSDGVRERLAEKNSPYTDVFFTSHGWKGDVPAAIEQYDAWIGAMEKVAADRATARQQRPGFKALVVGVHWPSLPWGDEKVPAGGALLSASTGGASVDDEVEVYASSIADSPTARDAIRTILEAAQRSPDETKVSPALRAAYDTLFDESGLGSGDRNGRPGSDQDGFDPAAIIADAQAAGVGREETGVPGVLGIRDKIRNALVMPLRQLSFWRMKDRARVIGETGSHTLLTSLQKAAPTAHFHLMGHSFGCIVVSATVAGAPNGAQIPRPVDSLFLVQGALSLWAFSPDIPYAKGTAGYFNRILKAGLVRGPIVTTRSTKDTAVGRLYPLGARVKKQLVLADARFPEYGGIGSFGVQGVDRISSDQPMRPATYNYQFLGGRVYNLEASSVIKNGGGASGAHSDISHPEVAHAFWSAVLSGGEHIGSLTARPPSEPILPSPSPEPGMLSPPSGKETRAKKSATNKAASGKSDRKKAEAPPKASASAPPPVAAASAPPPVAAPPPNDSETESAAAPDDEPTPRRTRTTRSTRSAAVDRSWGAPSILPGLLGGSESAPSGSRRPPPKTRSARAKPPAPAMDPS
ncbi:MAG: hypothetical protein ABIZ91_00170 [Gemmatimonadaceae bacterium]